LGSKDTLNTKDGKRGDLLKGGAREDKLIKDTKDKGRA